MEYLIVFIFGLSLLFGMVLTGLSIQPALELKDCTYQPIRSLEENVNRIEHEMLIDGELCYQNKTLINTFRACFQKPKKEALAPIGWIDFFANKLDSHRPSIKELIRQHNLYCPSNRVAPWEEMKLL